MMRAVNRILLVALGGALGCAGRFALSGALQKPGAFPTGTLAVNVLGCLAAGWLLGRQAFGEDIRTLLMPGLLGGFTTFSAFGAETLGLWQAGQAGLAAVNAGANLVLGFGAVWAGHLASRWVG